MREDKKMREMGKEKFSGESMNVCDGLNHLA